MSTLESYTARRKKKPKVLVLYNRPAQVPGTPAPEAGTPPRRRLDDVRAVIEGLREGGFEVVHHDIDDDPDRIMWAVVVERADLIYNLVDNMEGDYTHHATVTGYYWMLGMPYTGSEPMILNLCQDRARTHVLLDDAGVPVPGFVVVRDVNAVPETGEFDFPMVVTQAFDDIYYDEGFERPLYSREEIEARVAELAREFELPLLVEEYIEGRRLHALVIGNRALEVLPLTETVVPTEEEVAGWEAAMAEAAELEGEAESEGESEGEAESEGEGEGETEMVTMWNERIILAQLDLDTADHIRTLARRAFRVMGCRDCAQVDFHLDEAGVPHVVDVRPSFDHMPGSPFQVAADSSDRGYGGIVAEITRIACRRAKILDGQPEAEPAPEAAADDDSDGQLEADLEAEADVEADVEAESEEDKAS